jgi:DNA-binding Xre family transcriptional regulator
MSKFWIEQVNDTAGNRYWILFEHGQFHAPTAVMDDESAKQVARLILGINGAAVTVDIGKRLGDFRRNKKLGLRDVAELTGVSASTLSRIENGKDAIDHETYVKLVEALGDEW